MAAVCAAFS